MYQSEREKFDYNASATVYIRPWQTGISAQPNMYANFPFAEATNVLLGLPSEEQACAHIKIQGSERRFDKDKAAEISQLPDFPRD